MDTTYKEIVARLRINKNLLDDELEQQAQLQHHIATEVDHARDRLEAATNELEEHEAKSFVSVSDRHRETKVNLDYIKNVVRSDATRTDLWLSTNTARASYEQWDSLLQAWKSRGFALKALAELATANYFAVDTTYQENRKIIAENSARPARARRTVNNGV